MKLLNFEKYNEKNYHRKMRTRGEVTLRFYFIETVFINDMT